MQARDFAFWLQGFFEITSEGSANSDNLTENQVRMIKKHLSLVFIHDIDPKMGDAKHQKLLNETHDGMASGVPPWKPIPGARC